MRHGKAEEGYGKSDYDRELIERGYRDARLQAMHVFEQEQTHHFMVSGSARTRQTMQQIQEVLNVPDTMISFEEELYLASTRVLFKFIEQLSEEWEKVCFIGHNPTMIYLSEYLTKQDIGFIKTAGITKMSWEGTWKDVSEGGANLEYYKIPK